MAYKIPPGLSVVVPIKLKVDSNSYRWYDIPFTGPEKLILSEEIADDDQWHYNCYDFEDHVKYVSGLQNEEFIVLGMGFYFKPVGSSTTLYFDDVAFVSSKRELKQRVPHSQPSGMALNTVDIKLYQTHPNADVWNVTLVMEILPSLCDYDIPLMAFLGVFFKCNQPLLNNGC